MKRNFASLVFATLCGGILCTLSSCNDYDDEPIKSDISALQADLKTQIEQLQASQQTAIAALEEAYKAADTEAQQAAIAAAKALMEESAAALEGKIGALQLTVDGQVVSLANLEISVNELKTLHEGLKASLAIAAADASKALALAQTNETAIGSLREQLNAINTTLATLATKAELNEVIKNASKAQADATAALEAAAALRTDFGKENKEMLDSIASVKVQMNLAIAAALTDAESYTNDKISGLEKTLTQAIKDALAQAKQYTDGEISNLSQTLTKAIDDALAQAKGYTDVEINRIKGELEDKINANYTELKGKIDTLRTELNTLTSRVEALEAIVKASLDALITSIRYETQDVPVLKYGEVTGNSFKFGKISSTKTYEGAIDVKKGDKFITKKGGKLYLTINPAEVDFTNTSLALVNSQNEKHPVVTLSPLMKSNHLLTRASVANNGNGFYEVQATTGGKIDKNTEINPTVDGKQVLYALQNTYKSNGTDTKTITSNYGIDFSIEKANPINDFEWKGYYDEECTQVASSNTVLNTKYEFSYDPDPSVEEYVSYIKADITPADVYAFYIKYDANFFTEGSAYEKVYDGSEISNAFKFTCKKDNLNKPTEITYTILNYDGSIKEKAYNISYTQQLLEDIEITETVVPGAASDGYNGQGGFATLQLADKVRQALNDDDYTIYARNARKWNPIGISPSVYLASTWETSVSELSVEYDPMAIKFPNGADNNFKLNVTDDSGHKVFTITVRVSVEQPNHLDGYLEDRNRVPAAFGFSSTDGKVKFDDDVVAAWATLKSVPAPNLRYNLDGAFNRLEGLVPDADVPGRGGWKLSNGSVFEFSCNENAAQIDNYPNYAVSTTKENISVYGEVDDASKYKDKEFYFNLKQYINYYNCGKYNSEANDPFRMQFISPINYGFYKQNNNYETEIVFDVLPKDGVTKSLSNFIFNDYSEKPIKTFNLKDNRIKKVMLEIDKSNANYGLMKNFAWDEESLTLSFDYTSTSLNNEAVVDGILKVTDIWDVTSIVHVHFKLVKIGG